MFLNGVVDSVHGAGFWRLFIVGTKCLGPKVGLDTDMHGRQYCNADMGLDDAAVVLATTVLLMNEKNEVNFSHVYASFWLGIEQCCNRRQNIWYQTKPVANLHDTSTCTGNRRHYEVDL